MVLTLAGVSLFASLGIWQLERAAHKQAIEDKYASRLAADYQLYRQGDESGDIAYRKLRFEGRFDEQHNFLLDNQVYESKAGFQVLTPFRLRDSDLIVLVNRGWAAWGPHRYPLPEVEPVSDLEQVSGIVHLPEASVFQLGEVKLTGEWPQLIPYLDLELLREQYSPRLLPLVLWMDPDSNGSYVREWQPVWLPPEKSRAYAVQWFSFAAIALLLFIILNLRKVE